MFHVESVRTASVFFFAVALSATLPTIADEPLLELTPRPEVASDAPSQRVADTLVSLWPGWSWTSGASSVASHNDELDAAIAMSTLPESADRWHEAASALAARFGAQLEPGVYSHFGFVDAEIPAPESWAVDARLRFAAQEARSLHDCVTARNASDATAAASTFLRARFRRVAASHDRDVALWRARELTEGLAAYAAYRSLLAIESPLEARGVAVAIRRGMMARLDRAASEPELLTPALTGFALAMSLDRTPLEWHRMATEDHVSLDSLLAGPPKNFGNR